MKSTYNGFHTNASRAVSMVRLSNWQLRPLRPRNYGPVWICQPVWYIGDFFGMLTKPNKAKAMILALTAGSMPAQRLQNEVKQLERTTHVATD